MDYIIIVCEIVAFGQIKVEMRGENTKKKPEKGFHILHLYLRGL